MRGFVEADANRTAHIGSENPRPMRCHVLIVVRAGWPNALCRPTEMTANADRTCEAKDAIEA
jgi:hypothetical protein